MCTPQSAFDIYGHEHPLSAYSGKVSLVVNVASACGYTDSNYKGEWADGGMVWGLNACLGKDAAPIPTHCPSLCCRYIIDMPCRPASLVRQVPPVSETRSIALHAYSAAGCTHFTNPPIRCLPDKQAWAGDLGFSLQPVWSARVWQQRRHPRLLHQPLPHHLPAHVKSGGQRPQRTPRIPGG
jgi:hypothetical protein